MFFSRLSSCSLIQDRSLNLMDGTRLLDLERYEAAKQAAGLSDHEMSLRYVHCLDDSMVSWADTSCTCPARRMSCSRIGRTCA